MCIWLGLEIASHRPFQAPLSWEHGPGGNRCDSNGNAVRECKCSDPGEGRTPGFDHGRDWAKSAGAASRTGESSHPSDRICAATSDMMNPSTGSSRVASWHALGGCHRLLAHSGTGRQVGYIGHRGRSQEQRAARYQIRNPARVWRSFGPGRRPPAAPVCAPSGDERPKGKTVARVRRVWP